MSQVHEGPLATYNSLTDRNLSGYFGNTRMRRHLRKAGLINRRGEIVSENQYRVNMARKEHKKHVKELLAQAIVHKTLDLERYRQVEIKRKLEEIAKIELVRRVRASRGRKGDEEVLPYLSPRSMSRPQSERPSQPSSVHRRPKSAPAPPRNRPSSSRGFVDPYEDMYVENGPYRRLVIYVDDDGRPVSPPPSDRASSKDLRTEGIDSRHLYALDSEALQQYAMKLSKSERGRDGATSPYLISQYPVPPRSERVKSARSPRRSARMSARPELQQKEKKVGVRGTLMLHRQEPAMMHQGEVQTLCEITMKYHGPNLTLPRDQHDPTQEVAIEQQHCGGNTLPVFKERLQPGKTFSFISRRHRGYPFSLTLYIDGRVDCRISTCCEYKHGVGVRLGGKMGHFSLTRITGATPCYKCKLCCQAPPRSLKLKKGSFKKKKSPEPHEEVTVDNTPRSPVVPTKMEEPEINGKSDDDNYEDDFEDEENKYEDDFEADSNEDRRQIIGLQVDEVRENGQTVKIDVKEKEDEEAKEGTLPEHRRIEGYSSEDEDLQGGKEPFKVSADVHQTKQRERQSSSSSSSGSSRSSTPVQKVIQPTTNIESPKKEDQPLKSDRTDITDRSTTSTTSGSLTTATESTLEPRPPSAPKPQRRGKTSSSSSSSSSSSDDTEDEKYKRKKRDKRLKAEAERMKKEMEEKEMERKKRQQEEEERKKKEEDERKKRFEEEDRKRREEMQKRDEERKQRELEIRQKKEAEDRKREEELQRRKAEEDRMQASYEKQLQLIKLQRESDNNLLSPNKEEPQSSEKSVIEVEARTSYSQPPPAKEPEKDQPASDTESTTTRTSDTTATTESEGEKEKDKSSVTPMTTITEEKGKTERRSSTSSTGSSSSSSSEGELKVNDQKNDEPIKDEIKPVVVTETQQATVETKEEVEKPVVTKTEQTESFSDSSSSSGSSSESESDEDNKKVESPKPVITETKVVQEQETAETVVSSPPAPQQPASSSSGDTTTTETDSDSTPRPVIPQQQPQQEVQKSPSPVIEEKKDEPLKGMSADEPPQSVIMETKPETPKKEETEDSSSDSSSSDSSSDSESETETEDNKKQTSGQGKSVSESDGENMHGGNDPENVAGEGTRPESRLAQSSVKPPITVDGSILPLIKDESSVELNGVKLDDEQVTQLCNYIAEKDAINSVTVRNAGLDDMAFQNVALSLQVTLSTPSLLNFSQNQLSGKAMTHLSPAIKKNTELDILILNGNPVGNVGCKVIVDAILKAKDPFPFLRRASGYLTPSEAREQKAEGKPIDEDEPENKCKIREIDLGDAKISDAGITELSRLLENNKTVESLNLNGNTEISVKGWERFGQALKKNSTLKTLSLDFTDIGDDGLECLVKGLMVNTGIRALELESAGLTEKGGQLLCDLLKSNSSILELTVTTGNSISESTLNEIRKYLSLNNKS